MAIDSGYFAEDTNVPSKWIPVTERLPEVGRHVLAWSTVGDVYETAFWNGARWNVTWDHDEFVGVTHWMPLPDPAKEGTE